MVSPTADKLLALKVLIHLESHSHLTLSLLLLLLLGLSPLYLFGPLFILRAELLIDLEPIVIVILSKRTASKIGLVHLHWMLHAAASTRHHIHHG